MPSGDSNSGRAGPAAGPFGWPDLTRGRHQGNYEELLIAAETELEPQPASAPGRNLALLRQERNRSRALDPKLVTRIAVA